MTPEQFEVLVETHSKVNVMDERLEAIDARCAECHEEMRNTRKVLNGQPGNGERPGLKTRMGLVEQSCKEIKRSHRSQVRWFRIQLGAVISAVIAWFVKG